MRIKNQHSFFTNGLRVIHVYVSSETISQSVNTPISSKLIKINRAKDLIFG